MNLKIKLLFIFIFLSMLAALPFLTLNGSTAFNGGFSSSTNDSPNISDDKNSSDVDYIVKITASICKNDFDDKTPEAAAILVCSNYNFDKSTSGSVDTEKYIPSGSSNEEAAELYPKIKKAVKKYENANITYNGKSVYVPYSLYSDGRTLDDERYEYLTSVASPWDCFLQDKAEKYECTGVSIYGIDYLCKRGYSAVEALKWYLPNLSIDVG